MYDASGFHLKILWSAPLFHVATGEGNDTLRPEDGACAAAAVFPSVIKKYIGLGMGHCYTTKGSGTS